MKSLIANILLFTFDNSSSSELIDYNNLNSTWTMSTTTAVEKKPTFTGVQLYTLTNEKCLSDLKIKQRQATVLMLFVEKLRVENVIEHGEPTPEQLGGEEAPVISLDQKQSVLNDPRRLMLSQSQKKRISDSDSSEGLAIQNNADERLSSSLSGSPSSLMPPPHIIQIIPPPSDNINIDSNNRKQVPNSVSTPSSIHPSPGVANSQSSHGSGASVSSAGSVTADHMMNFEDMRRPTKEDVELAMDLLYTVGEEDEEAIHLKRMQDTEQQLQSLMTDDSNYQALMGSSGDHDEQKGICIPINDGLPLSAMTETQNSLSGSFHDGLNMMDPSPSMHYGSVPYGGADRYFASKTSTAYFASDFKSKSGSEEDAKKKKKPRRCLPYPEKKLSESEKKKRDYCLKKIQQLRSPIAPKLHDLVAQDCIIPERFRYKYFNPDRSDRTVHPSKVYLKLKLVITEMSTSTAHRIIRTVGTVFGALKEQYFGMYHSALIIGDYYVEWSDSSIATVRKKSSSKAVFVIDVHTYRDQKEINEAFNRISEAVCEWNGTKIYDNKKANCQHFVMDILTKLGLSEDLFDNMSGSVKKYLDRLKTYGVCEMNYVVDEKKRKLILNSKKASKELKELVKQKEIVFPSHKLLDEFVYIIEQEGGVMYFEQNVQEQIDHMLLKAFDRAFWLRNEASTNNKDNTKPLDNERGETNCPFSQVDKNGKLIDHTIHNSHLFTGTYSTEFPER